VHSVLGKNRTVNFTLLKQWSNSPTQFLISVSTVYPFHCLYFSALIPLFHLTDFPFSYCKCLFLLSSTVLSLDWIPTLFSYVIYTPQSIFFFFLISFHLTHHTLGRTELIGPSDLVHLHRLCLDTHPYSMLNSNSHSKSSKTVRPLD